MKALRLYLEELFVTPANTMGMGNPSMPSEPDIQGGSGDIPIGINLKTNKIYKKRKKLKIKKENQ